MSPLRIVSSIFASAIFLASVALGKSTVIAVPGDRPKPLGVHALVEAKVVTKPGEVLEKATILLRDGRIEAVGGDVKVPTDARVWDLKGKMVYAGFVEPYWLRGEEKGKLLRLGHAGHAEETAALSFHGAKKVKDDPGSSGPGYELSSVTPERKVTAEYAPGDDDLKGLRELGFGAAHVIPTRGVFRGTSALALLQAGDPNEAILKGEVAHCIAFDVGKDGREGGYPHSLMGAIAVIRQTLMDTRHHAAAKAYFAKNPESLRPAYNPSLDALQGILRKEVPAAFFLEPGSTLMIHRAGKVAKEFGLQPVLVATGQEWRRLDLVVEAADSFIVPLDFPALSKMPEEDDWNQVSLDLLRNWDHAPSNPSLLRDAGCEIAFTTGNTAGLGSFRKNLRSTLDRGLTEEDALAALTTIPAKLCGASDLLGSIEPGNLANLVVVEGGSYFEKGSAVTATWVNGRRYAHLDAEAKKPEPDEKADEVKKLLAERSARVPSETRRPLAAPPAVLVRGATIWTLGKQGILQDADLLAVDGKIRGVGKNLKVPLGMKAREVDGRGKHLVPGIIDCHSHSMILGRVNEATLPSTAMVRIEDVVNSESVNVERQLASGVTACNLLHGSANPIGGQNAVIKLRLGSSPDGMLFAKAPAGIKFALGENVKQSNWGDKYTTRFPQTRMGVKTFFANRFTAARQHLVAKESFVAGKGPPVAPNLELQAIGEIIKGTRLIHCHSYRQDEILVFLRTMESFGVRVGTLQHVLEGYKVADEIAAHGAGGSAFSDWWAYKFEVYDAIPYAGAIMHDRGVTVSFNSDSSDHARRLNLEAAKAVKYGGMDEIEALKFVTLNPAKQLGVGKFTGSLELGKDADFALWTGHPLHYTSLCLETWVDGVKQYARTEAAAQAEARYEEREALLAKAKQALGLGADDEAPQAAKDAFFRNALETACDLHPHSCRSHEGAHGQDFRYLRHR